MALAGLLALVGCGPRVKPPAIDVRDALRVERFNCLIDRDPKRVTIVGEVRNASDQWVRAALIVASLKSPTGVLKGSGEVVVMDLKPGGTKPFRIVSRYRQRPPKPRNIEFTIMDPPRDRAR